MLKGRVRGIYLSVGTVFGHASKYQHTNNRCRILSLAACRKGIARAAVVHLYALAPRKEVRIGCVENSCVRAELPSRCSKRDCTTSWKIRDDAILMTDGSRPTCGPSAMQSIESENATVKMLQSVAAIASVSRCPDF